MMSKAKVPAVSLKLESHQVILRPLVTEKGVCTVLADTINMRLRFIRKRPRSMFVVRLKSCSM